jgi:hypothetical protein
MWMPESDGFWDFYWEMRLQELQNLGKRAAILTASKLIRRLSERTGQIVRLLELGCGEAQIIGALVEAHSQVPGINASVGVDYIHSAILTCRARYPMMKFVEGDFTHPELLQGLGTFEVVLMVNALHEVFTSGFSSKLGEIDVPEAKHRVEKAFAGAVDCLVPGGWVVLFDGLETTGDLSEIIRLRFRSGQARSHFKTFAREYHPFKISYHEADDPFCVELSRRDFTRYITKSIFLGKALWQTERLESYQYFNEAEFRTEVARAGLVIRELRTLSVDEEKWHNVVQIETPGVNFPVEHILIVAQKCE